MRGSNSMGKQDAAYWIEHLKLLPHPEGGFYKEVFRSEQAVRRVSDDRLKQACTSIYYLLEGIDFSGFHRLSSDEIWYFHKGEPLTIYVIGSDGQLDLHELSDQESGQLCIVIRAGLWFASAVTARTGFSLASCAVAPGFDFAEFEMADGEKLAAEYPTHREIIARLSR